MTQMRERNFDGKSALFLSSDHFGGLMVDFEAFPMSGQKGYVALLNELSSDLHAKGMKLYVSVPAHNEEFDYAAISAPADGVIVMNYDEHYRGQRRDRWLRKTGSSTISSLLKK